MRDSAYAIGIVLKTVKEGGDVWSGQRGQARASDSNLLSFRTSMTATLLLILMVLTSAAMTIGADNFFPSDDNSTTVFAKDKKSDDSLVHLIQTLLGNASLISHMLPVTLYAGLDILYAF